MSRPVPDPRPLAFLGAFLLGAGTGFRLLLPPEPVAAPFSAAIAPILLLAGAGVVLLERVFRGGAPTPRWAWVLPLVVLAGVFPTTAASLSRGIDFLAAIAAGLALRDLVVHDGFRRPVVRALVVLGALLGTLALAQSLYQRQELRELLARGGLPEALATDQGRAFLASDRASATLINANSFAGLLLLILPLAASGRRSRWLLIPLLGGFFAAGSAGATLALLLACGVLLCRSEKPAPHWAKLGFTAGLCGLLVLVVAITTAWEPPIVGGKVRTFAQRIDYHLMGARLMPEMGWHGAGFEATADLRMAESRPGESSSAYLHDSWMQLLLEAGPLCLVAGVLLLLTFARLVRTAQRPGPTDLAAPWLERAWLIGVVLAATTSPLLVRMVTLLPLTWELRWLDALLNGGLACALLMALKRGVLDLGSWLSWLTLAVGAFLIHGFLDFDLYAPAVALSFALVLALLPSSPASAGKPTRLGLSLLAVLFLTAPLLVGLLALQRDDAALALKRLSGDGVPPKAAALEPLARGPAHDAAALEAWALMQLGRTPAAVEQTLDALPSRLRGRPSFRRAEARYLDRRAALDRDFAPEATERLEGLVRPGEWAEADLLHLLWRTLRQRGAEADSRARSVARRALDAAARWDRDPTTDEFLAALQRFLGQ